jgi:hypothetical protein
MRVAYPPQPDRPPNLKPLPLETRIPDFSIEIPTIPCVQSRYRCRVSGMCHTYAHKPPSRHQSRQLCHPRRHHRRKLYEPAANPRGWDEATLLQPQVAFLGRHGNAQLVIGRHTHPPSCNPCSGSGTSRLLLPSTQSHRPHNSTLLKPVLINLLHVIDDRHRY